MKSFPLPLGCLYKATGSSYVPFLLFLNCSRASLPKAAVSLEKLPPASLTPAPRRWSPSMQHEPGKAPDAADLEQWPVILSPEQASHQRWTLSKAVFTSVSMWKMSYAVLFAEFKEKRNRIFLSNVWWHQTSLNFIQVSWTERANCCLANAKLVIEHPALF